MIMGREEEELREGILAVVRSRFGWSRHSVLRLLLLAVLAFGVVTMHHVAEPDVSCCPSGTTADVGAAGHDATHDASLMSSAPDASTTADEHSSHSAGQHLLHLCLAVLGAAAFAVGIWLLLGRRLPTAVRWFQTRVAARTAPLRPPRRRHGVTLLLSLCVMRT